MAEPHLDHPGEIHWFSGHGPAPVIGPCPHAGCRHHGQSVIAWGPTLDRYELVECGIPGSDNGCAGRCRAWVDGHGRTTTAWLQVDLAPPVVSDSGECRHCRRPIQLVDGIGWLHDELPQYANQPITCDNAQPLPSRTPSPKERR